MDKLLDSYLQTAMKETAQSAGRLNTVRDLLCVVLGLLASLTSWSFVGSNLAALRMPFIDSLPAREKQCAHCCPSSVIARGIP